MTTPTNPINPFSSFLPSTYNIPEEEDRVREFIGATFSEISDVINDKKIGAYTENTQSENGNKFSYDTTKKVRNGFQAIARIKSFVPQTIPLPITDVNPQFIISLVYGSASLPCSAVGAGDGNYFSFMPRGDSRIFFDMSDLTITISTDGARAAYQGIIVIEYIRDGV